MILDASYIIFVYPVYEYEGFYLEFNFASYIISWLLYLCVIPFVSSRIKDVSDYILVSFVMFLIAPLTSLYGLSGRTIWPLIVTIASFLLFKVIVQSNSIKVPKLPLVKDGIKWASGISIVVVLGLVFWYVISGATLNFDLARVYEYRRSNAELTNIGILAYLTNWGYKVFSLFLIALALYKKRYIFLVLLCIVQIIFYGYSAHKSVLFSLPVVFATWAWFSRSDKAYILPLSVILIHILSLVLYLGLDHIVTSSMLIRRVFFVPALLTYHYFDFFAENPFVYWSNSVLSNIVTYPYTMPVPMLIGDYSGSGASANNGFISSGYGHMGYFGVIIYTVLFAYIIRCFDVFTRRTGALWLSLAITLIPLRDALISSDLFTTLLTHGLLVSIFLVFLIRTKAPDPVNQNSTKV